MNLLGVSTNSLLKSSNDTTLVRRRDSSIDLVKIVAMTMVICLHIQFGKLDMPLAFFLSSASGIAIPLFFMVNGYLMVNRKIDYRYALRKIFNIIRFVFIITLPFAIIDLIRGYANIKGALFQLVSPYLQIGYFFVFWYLGAMCIMYAIMPIINRFLKRENVLKVLITLLVFEQIIFTLNVRYLFEYNVIQTFRIWNFITYFVLGAFIWKFQIRKMPFIAVLISCCVFICFVKFVGRPEGIEYYISSLLCTCYAFITFVWLRQQCTSERKSIHILSRLFLPVYSFHMFAVYFLNRELSTNTSVIF